jgi:hypothetical protein
MTFSLRKHAGMSLRLPLAVSLLALGLAGCATPRNYPSLLPRAAEKTNLGEPVPPPPAEAIADPVLDARIAAAVRVLDERAAAFDAAAVRAGRQVTSARRAPAGSAAWLDAQVALAELDTLRSSTQESVTDLDEMANDRATALDPEYPALDAAIARARTVVEAQLKRIADLQGALAPA